MRHTRWELLLLSLVALGCGSISYKLGGSESERKAAAEDCVEQGHTEGSAGFARCMQDRGWTVKQLDADNTAKPVKKESITESAPQNEPTPVPLEALPSPTSAAPTPAEEPSTLKRWFQFGGSESEPTPIQGPSTVKGWFKFGGTDSTLAADKKRCSEQVEVADRPVAGSDVISAKMLECMRNQGWRPIE